MTKVPKEYEEFLKSYPEVGKAYKSLGSSALAAGPLSKKDAQLIKLGIAVGSGRRGAIRSNARKAQAVGATVDEVRHAVLLSVTTIGFPGMMFAMSMVNDVLDTQ